MLDASAFVFALITLLLLLIFGTRAALAAGGGDRSNDNVMTFAGRLAGSAFVFIAAFAGVSEWQLEGERESLAREQFTLAAQIQRASIGSSREDEIRLALRTYAQATVAGPMDPRSTADVMVVLESISQESSLDIDIRDLLVAFGDLHNHRMMMPEYAVPWPIRATVLILGCITMVIAARYPMGGDRRLKILQSSASFAVIVATITALTLLQSTSVESARLAEIPRAFLEG